MSIKISLNSFLLFSCFPVSAPDKLGWSILHWFERPGAVWWTRRPNLTDWKQYPSADQVPPSLSHSQFAPWQTILWHHLPLLPNCQFIPCDCSACVSLYVRDDACFRMFYCILDPFRTLPLWGACTNKAGRGYRREGWRLIFSFLLSTLISSVVWKDQKGWCTISS